MNWIITNIEEPDLCWSNTDGWVEEDFDTFTDDEKQTLNLPVDGQWEPVKWGVK